MELLHNIPSTLKHLQFRRVYGRYGHLLEVIQRNNNLEILNIFEIGNLQAIRLESIIDFPVAQSLKILRIRHLLQQTDVDYGALISQVLPHLTSLKTFAFEVCSMKDEPFFSTLIKCKTIRHFKFGYCDSVTTTGTASLARHGELVTLEFMPLLLFDLDTLRMIIDGNPKLQLLLLPKEAISEDVLRHLPYVARGHGLT
jgi:hypothetical protein